jgi:hypothetical protein
MRRLFSSGHVHGSAPPNHKGEGVSGDTDLGGGLFIGGNVVRLGDFGGVARRKLQMRVSGVRGVPAVPRGTASGAISA